MQKLLREALIELIDERGFESLTIGEITERAMVSRAAFYRAYRDKYDLVEQLFDEAMCSLLNSVADMGSTPHPHAVWVTFFEHIAAYDRLYRSLLGQKGSPWFIRKMRLSLIELIKEHERIPVGRHEGERLVFAFSDGFVPDVMAAMFAEAITWWLEHDRPFSPTEMANRCTRLAFALFKTASAWS